MHGREVDRQLLLVVLAPGRQLLQLLSRLLLLQRALHVRSSPLASGLQRCISSSNIPLLILLQEKAVAVVVVVLCRRFLSTFWILSSVVCLSIR